jgi:hypothetical protein
LEIEKEAKKELQENTSQATATQSVKLQKYTITPFTGDFKELDTVLESIFGFPVASILRDRLAEI